MTTAQANQAAFERLTKAEPVLVDIRPAIEAVPGMTRHMVLTSGPPIITTIFGAKRLMVAMICVVCATFQM